LLRGAMDLAEQGMLTSGDRTNREYVGDAVSITPTLSKAMRSLLYDPQTAGGLLISVAESRADALLHRLRQTYPQAAIIGRVTPSSNHLVVVL
jgi:selenide,water dikinase